MKFLHTADWQIGKPFAGIRDPHKRSIVQQARIEAIQRIGTVARDADAQFVLVTGDLFDSPSADKATVSAACSAIGQIGLPVYAIPGNHDHGGPGSVWEQEFFLREQTDLAPNLTILLESAAHECDSAVLLPCPLLRRSIATDPTEWLRDPEVYAELPTDKPRIVVAHGSTQAFTGEWEDDEENSTSNDLIDLSRLPDAEIDYIALGDWHGAKQVSDKAWFSGTPELDRFPKGGGHDPGNVLLVNVQRGAQLQIDKIPTAKLKWDELAFDIADDTALTTLEERLTAIVGQRANEDLLRLTLTGSVGIEASTRLDQILESLEARILRLKMANQIRIAPTAAEIEALTQRASDPLIASVATKLVDQSSTEDEAGQIARIALRELHAACMQEAAS